MKYLGRNYVLLACTILISFTMVCQSAAAQVTEDDSQRGLELSGTVVD